MSDAPHRIWVSAPNEDNEVETWTDPDEGGSPYILATPAALFDHPTVKALVATERDAWRKGSEAQATEVEALRKERDDALDAARQQDALRGATLATTRSVSADLAAAQAQIEALKAILHDAGALRDAADRVSEWFCTEARHLEGPRIQALRMAVVAYDRHMQPTALSVPNFSAGWPLEEGDGSIIVGAALTAKEGE